MCLLASIALFSLKNLKPTKIRSLHEDISNCMYQSDVSDQQIPVVEWAVYKTLTVHIPAKKYTCKHVQTTCDSNKNILNIL